MTSSSTWRAGLVTTTLLLSSALHAEAQTISFIESKDYAVGLAPVSVAAGDFNGDGLIDLVVANSGSDTVSVLLSNRNGNFQAARSFAAGHNPQSVAVGDFNGDGSLDLAIADYYGGISVLLGNGDGTFQAFGTFAAGSYLRSVAVADFNRDGVLDLAVANSTDVSVLLGNADGTFQAARPVVPGDYPRSVAIDDFNGDGVPDLAIANFGPGALNSDRGHISVALGNGDGTFQAPRNFDAGFEPVSMAVGDFNGDGHLDLVAANRLSKNLSILLGNGDGTFQTHRDFADSVGSGLPESVAVGDFNGDGERDLAVVRSGGGNDAVSVLLGNGDGTFQAPLTYASSGPVSVVTGDFSGDGVPDLALANLKDNTASVMLGNGDGTLQAARTFGPGGASVAVGDFNGDGVPDVAVADQSNTVPPGSVSVRLGNRDGTFQAGLTFAVGTTSPRSVAVADINGDGKLDLVVACEGDYPTINPGDISVLLGNGDGTFQPAQTFAAGITPVSVAVGDFNGDHVPDLVVANWADGTVSVLLGNGDGTFQAARGIATGSHPNSVAVSDFNGDGKLDFAVANLGDFSCSADGQCQYVSSNVLVLLGNGDGTFQAGSTLADGEGPLSVAVGDVNGDALPDLVVISEVNATGVTHTVAVLLGNGDGTFQAPRAFALADGPWYATVGDFNGDGVQDLAVSPGITVLQGNGDGSFQAGRNFVPYNASSTAVGDFNGDGKLDLVTNSIAVLINTTAAASYNLAVSKAGNGNGTVTSSSTPAGANEIDCGTTCTAAYPSGTVVTLMAQAAIGSTFAQWSGCDAVSETTCTVTMSAAKSVTATFALQQFTLSVSKDGIGSGTVTSSSSPEGATEISCGVTCSATYDWSTVVTLSARPALGNLLYQWKGCDAVSGNSCIVAMSSAKSVTATFLGVPINLVLSVASNASGQNRLTLAR
jgi:hypothetical protein